MMWGTIARLRALFQRSVTDAELDEELRYHLDRETERNVARGLSEREARDAARQSLGNLTVHSEQAREAFGWTWLERLGQDATYGWRSLWRSRTFTIVAVMSLALGIGANSMIFGVTYSVLFEPLPVRSPDRLIALERVAGTETSRSFSVEEVDALRTAPGIAGVTADGWSGNAAVVAGGQRYFEDLDFVDGNHFTTIGLGAYRGRVIDTVDVAAGASVVVISTSLATRAFGSPEQAVGQTMTIRDVPVTIIGVTPPAFRGLDYPGWFAVALPVTLAPLLDLPDYARRSGRSLEVVARMAPGVTQAQAAAALDAVFQQCCPHAEAERLSAIGMTRGIGGGKNDAREEYAPLLYILAAGAGVVLIIACANVGNLLLVRASVREREIAVRMSLGASRGRIVRQLLMESLLLGLMGGLVALPFAALGTLGVERLIPARMSVYADIVRWHAKPALLGFTALVSVTCVTLFGLVPAMRATRANLAASLKSGGRGSVGPGRRLLDRATVVAQLSFALLLVSAASLLVASLRNIAREDGGFASSGVTLVSVETRGTQYERDGIVPIHAEMLRRVRAIPGVQRAGMATQMPIAGGRNVTISLDADGALVWRSLALTSVSPEYLSSVGIALRSGRDFTARDDATSERVAILSEAVAQRAFPGRNAVGQFIHIRGDSVHTLRVIGVARDTKMFGLRGDRVPVVYTPVTQTGTWPFLGLAVRMPDGAEALTRQITAAIEASAPGVRIRKVSTMRSEIRESMFTERLAASISTLFGTLALLLAAVGVYGVVAFNVARRTNEIGIRVALGARRRDILGLVLRSSLSLVVMAIVVGGPLAFIAGRALRSQLFGVRANNPLLLLIALAALVVVALIATSVPARRATRIDPLVALRSD
jgi:predicted permease